MSLSIANISDAEDRLDEAVTSYLEAVEAGHAPQRDDWLARYADVAPELAGFFMDQDRVERRTADLRALAQAVLVSTPMPGATLPLGLPGEREVRSLGDYELLEEIGRGGMGVVYRARQKSLNRLIALKVLPLAATLDPRRLQRFHNEARAVAGLHHPHIVPVFAVGEANGVHFYAMQLIEGPTLAGVLLRLRAQAVGKEPPKPAVAREDSPREATTAHRPGAPAMESMPPQTALSTEGGVGNKEYIRAVARLGVQAAEALDHAHQLGVVHRDIKPANLMIDGRGQLWITDFGLAQFRDGEASLTLTGDLIGTLRYMSPEQAMARQAVIDHRSDVYSLGATLYELLTMRPVYDGGTREELLRQIAFEEPQRLLRLNKAIPAELETIVLKALEKNPKDRYASAQELADDLERHLKDEPIRARRPGVWVRVAKWARRHKPLVASIASSGAILVVAMVVGALWYAARAGQLADERVHTNEQINAALAEAAEQVSQAQAGGRDPSMAWAKARETARRAETLAESNLAEPALVDRVRMLRAKLDVEEQDRRMLGLLEQARLPPLNLKADDYDFRWSTNEYASAFRSYGIDVEALTVGEASARIAKRAIQLPLVAALDDWAAHTAEMPVRRRLIEIARAVDRDPWRDQVRVAFLRNDLPALKALSTSADVEALPAPTLLLLGDTLASLGEYGAAAALLRRAQPAHAGDFWINHQIGLFLVHKQPPATAEAIPFFMVAAALHPDSAIPHNNLGNVLAETGQLDAAITEYREAIRLKKGNPRTHSNLGNALSAQGKLAEAILEYRQAIRLKEDFPEAYNHLGDALRFQGNLDAAITAIRHAVELKKDFPEAHYNLGMALAGKGQLDEAIAEYQQVIQLKKDFAQPHNDLGIVLERKGQLDAAIAEYRQAIHLKKDYAEAHINLGTVLEQKGELDAAIAEYREAIQAKKNFAVAHYNLANALRNKRDLTGAIAEYREAIRLKPDDPKAYNSLGVALATQGDLNGAIAAYRQATRLKPDMPEAHNNLGSALLEKGDLEAAIVAYREAIRVKNDYARAHGNLGVALAGTGRLDEAITEYRHALQHRKDDPETYFRLTSAFKAKGDFRSALDAVRRGHELGSNDPHWRVHSARWVREQERLVELDDKLPGILENKTKPASAAEGIELAELCTIKRLYMAAARFYEDVFKAQPGLLQAHRYQAACAAARGGCGQGKDASKFDEHERERLRGQALRWLRDELAKRSEQPRSTQSALEQMLRHWQRDPDLAGVRDPDPLATLPAAEQTAWRELWADVANVLQHAQQRK